VNVAVLRMLTVPGSVSTNNPVANAKALTVCTAAVADADAKAVTLNVPELVNDSTAPASANWSTPNANADAKASVEAVDARDAVADRQHGSDLGDLGLGAEAGDLVADDLGNFSGADVHSKSFPDGVCAVSLS